MNKEDEEQKGWFTEEVHWMCSVTHPPELGQLQGSSFSGAFFSVWTFHCNFNNKNLRCHRRCHCLRLCVPHFTTANNFPKFFYETLDAAVWHYVVSWTHTLQCTLHFTLTLSSAEESQVLLHGWAAPGLLKPCQEVGRDLYGWREQTSKSELIRNLWSANEQEHFESMGNAFLLTPTLLYTDTESATLTLYPKASSS